MPAQPRSRRIPPTYNRRSPDHQHCHITLNHVLVALPNGRLRIIDYKTNKGTPPSPARIGGSLVPFLYYALVRANYQTTAQIEVSYLYLRTMKWVVVSYDPETVAACKMLLRDVVQKITNQTFVPQPSGHCLWCPVRDRCPALQQEERDLDELL